MTEKQDKSEVLEDVKAVVDDYQSLSNSQIKTERLGGLSNQIWKVSAKGRKTLIYRKFGEGSGLCDRERENYILQELSEIGIAPKYIGGDEEYRIEKFCKGEELTPSALHDKPLRRRIAKLLAELHSINLEKLDKSPSFLRLLTDGTFLKEFEDKAKQADVFTPMERKIVKDIETLTTEEEIAFLKEIAPKKAGSVVFSHNDLHSQNILEIEKHSKYILIDFEYSNYNFRGYDIANIFNEAMFEYGTDNPPFYTVDESNFPSDDNLREFIRYYLFFIKFNKEEFDLESILQHDSYLQEYINKNHDFNGFLKEVEEIFQEVKICQLFSHYFWILWSVVKSKEGGFEFDHLHYAAKRLQFYRRLKDELPIGKKNSKESQNASIP